MGQQQNKDHIGGVYGKERRAEILAKPLKGDQQKLVREICITP